MKKQTMIPFHSLFSVVACLFLLLMTACNSVPVEELPIPTTAPTEPAATSAPTMSAATATTVPTATTAPAEPTATATPVPTATTAPTEPTATATPVPTATTAPAEPTATPTPVPTATTAPTEPAATATPVPTATTAPAEPTATPTPTPLPTPQFSAEGGFYNKEFQLTLSSEAGEIYYTTDGTDPRTSDTAVLYNKEIRIYDNTSQPNVYSAITDIVLDNYQPPQFNVDKGIIIRAVVKTASGEYGAVTANSYFVGKTAACYSDFRVISMVTDADYLFDPDTGAYMVGSGYYKWANSSDYVEYAAGDTQNPTNYNKEGKETEFPVTIQVFENGTSVYSADVGARIAGNWTRSGPQKSFRFYARKDYGTSKMKYAFFDNLTDSNNELIKKFDKVTLRNGGNDHILHFRDAFIQELSQGLALDYMASEPCILFLNGEYWGFYLLREKPEDYYIQSHYGIDDKEVIFIKNGALDSGTEEDYEAAREFFRWAVSADMTVDANYKKFCEQMDVQSFMDYMTVETYVNNQDWANGYLNNWMIWRSKTVNPDLLKADGKWRFILYDLDLSAGLYGGENTSYRNDSINTMYTYDENFNFPSLLKNLCNNKEFKQQFYDNYIHIIDTCFDPDTVTGLLNTYISTYGNATKDSLRRFGLDWAADSYDDEVNGLRTYFEKRPKYAKQQLDKFYGLETEEPQSSTLNIPVQNVSGWYFYGDATSEADDAANAFYVNVPKPMEYSWDIQSGASNLALEKDGVYRITFTASCDGVGALELFVNRQDENGDYPTAGIANLTLTKDLATYEFTFTMPLDTHSDWRLCFNYGLGSGNYVIKDVALVKIVD